MGLLRPIRNPENGYRLYQDREVAWLRFIQQAKRLGYTLKEILEIKHEADQDQSPCLRVREILQNRIFGNRQDLEALMSLQARMEKVLAQWADMPDGVPDSRSVCHLIESFSKNDSEYPDNAR